MEVWKKIRNHDRYEVSSYGRVRNSYTGKLLKPGVHKQGYLLVWLCENGTRYAKSVHRLVAEAFIQNPNNKPQVNHKNGDKTDNNVKNLEWVTGSENTIHAYRTSLFNGRPKVRVKIVETGEIFDSIKDCALAIGGTKGNVSSCASGRIETYKNFHIKYV